MKKLRTENLLPSNCENFKVSLLNPVDLKNRNIHSFHERKDKRWYTRQNILLSSAMVVVDIEIYVFAQMAKISFFHPDRLSLRQRIPLPQSVEQSK